MRKNNRERGKMTDDASNIRSLREREIIDGVQDTIGKIVACISADQKATINMISWLAMALQNQQVVDRDDEDNEELAEIMLTIQAEIYGSMERYLEALKDAAGENKQ